MDKYVDLSYNKATDNHQQIICWGGKMYGSFYGSIEPSGSGVAGCPVR